MATKWWVFVLCREIVEYDSRHHPIHILYYVFTSTHSYTQTHYNVFWAETKIQALFVTHWFFGDCTSFVCSKPTKYEQINPFQSNHSKFVSRRWTLSNRQSNDIELCSISRVSVSKQKLEDKTFLPHSVKHMYFTHLKHTSSSIPSTIQIYHINNSMFTKHTFTILWPLVTRLRRVYAH